MGGLVSSFADPYENDNDSATAASSAYGGGGGGTTTTPACATRLRQLQTPIASFGGSSSSSIRSISADAWVKLLTLLADQRISSSSSSSGNQEAIAVADEDNNAGTIVFVPPPSPTIAISVPIVSAALVMLCASQRYRECARLCRYAGAPFMLEPYENAIEAQCGTIPAADPASIVTLGAAQYDWDGVEIAPEFRRPSLEALTLAILWYEAVCAYIRLDDFDSIFTLVARRALTHAAFEWLPRRALCTLAYTYRRIDTTAFLAHLFYPRSDLHTACASALLAETLVASSTTRDSYDTVMSQITQPEHLALHDFSFAASEGSCGGSSGSSGTKEGESGPIPIGFGIDCGNILFRLALIGRPDLMCGIAGANPALFAGTAQFSQMNIFQYLLVRGWVGDLPALESTERQAEAADMFLRIVRVWNSSPNAHSMSNASDDLLYIRNAYSRPAFWIATSMAWIFLFARLAIYHNSAYFSVIRQSIRAVPTEMRLWPIYYPLASACVIGRPPQLNRWRTVRAIYGHTADHAKNVIAHICLQTFGRVIPVSYAIVSPANFLQDIRPPHVNQYVWIAMRIFIDKLPLVSTAFSAASAASGGTGTKGGGGGGGGDDDDEFAPAAAAAESKTDNDSTPPPPPEATLFNSLMVRAEQQESLRLEKISTQHRQVVHDFISSLTDSASAAYGSSKEEDNL